MELIESPVRMKDIKSLEIKHLLDYIAAAGIAYTDCRPPRGTPGDRPRE